MPFQQDALEAKIMSSRNKSLRETQGVNVCCVLIKIVEVQGCPMNATKGQGHNATPCQTLVFSYAVAKIAFRFLQKSGAVLQ